jgi:hypothetical protein
MDRQECLSYFDKLSDFGLRTTQRR